MHLLQKSQNGSSAIISFELDSFLELSSSIFDKRSLVELISQPFAFLAMGPKIKDKISEIWQLKPAFPFITGLEGIESSEFISYYL